MKLDDKKILNIFTMCIVIVLPIIYMISFYLKDYKIIRDYDSIRPTIVFYISIPFLIYTYIKDIKDRKRKLDKFDYLFFILVIIGIISVIFSIHKPTAIFGKPHRREGFLSVLTYYLLFINWKNYGTKKDIKRYIKIFSIIAIVNSIYGLLQIYSHFKFIHSGHYLSASGFCGHPNFFGSLIVTILSIITANFLIENKKNIKKIFIIILLFIALINAQSTGPFMTYIITLIFIIVYLCIKKKIVLKNIFILLAILIPIYISIYSLNKYVYKYDRCELCDVKNNIENNNISTSVEKIANGRIKIWKNTIEVIKKYPITGVGFDNLVLAYPNPKMDNSVSFVIEDGVVKRIPSKKYIVIDNAHNVYLHTFASTGIFGILTYLILLLFTFITGLKSEDKGVMILLCGFVAYSIQAFANISVITVAPIYYIMIGLILSDIKTKSKNKSLT